MGCCRWVKLVPAPRPSRELGDVNFWMLVTAVACQVGGSGAGLCLLRGFCVLVECVALDVSVGCEMKLGGRPELVRWGVMRAWDTSKIRGAVKSWVRVLRLSCAKVRSLRDRVCQQTFPGEVRIMVWLNRRVLGLCCDEGILLQDDIPQSFCERRGSCNIHSRATFEHELRSGRASCTRLAMG